MRTFVYLGLGVILFTSTISVGAEPAAKTNNKPAEKSDEKQSVKPAAKPQPHPVPAESADLAAIRKTSLEFETAFNGGNAGAVAGHWTEDGDYQSESGEVFTGRKAIEAQYKEFFATHKNHRLKIVIDSLRLLSDSAAIEDGRAMLDPAPAGAPAICKYTAVHVKVNGKWLMSTVRDTRVETPSGYEKVADLEWLIGTWHAEDHGAKTVSVCQWVANKSFVQRSYTTTLANHSTTSGIQLIGFNPQSGKIQSWSFNSDGGFTIGIWSPRENGWSAKTYGTTGAGHNLTATNLLTRLDDNAYAWQSVDRTADGKSLPNTAEVILKRQAK